MLARHFAFAQSDSGETIDDLEDDDFPSPREDLRELGKSAMAHRDLHSALKHFTDAIGCASSHSEVYLDRAACYESMQVGKAAIETPPHPLSRSPAPRSTARRSRMPTSTSA